VTGIDMGIFVTEEGCQLVLVFTQLKEAVVNIDVPTTAGEAVGLFVIDEVKIDVF
jgi:hypothetical protein